MLGSERRVAALAGTVWYGAATRPDDKASRQRLAAGQHTKNVPARRSGGLSTGGFVFTIAGNDVDAPDVWNR